MENIRLITKHKLMKEDKHTPEEWYNMIDDLKRCIVEVPTWVFYHFLESVPPIYPKNRIGFFNSEPLSHNKEGHPVYYYFFKYDTKYYGCITTKGTQEFCYKLALESIKTEVV